MPVRFARKSRRFVGHRKLWLQQLEQRISPAIYTVTSSADSGPGSLRQTMIDIGNNAGTHTIVFDPSISQIALTSGHIAIFTPANHTLSILGPGADKLKLSSSAVTGKWHSVFSSAPYANSKGTITISGMTFTDCKDGAVRVADGAFNLSNLVFKDNSSSAALSINDSIYAANVNVTNCTFENNLGSGIKVSNSKAALTIASSNFNNNSSSGIGGAIGTYSIGSLNVSDSTFNDNTSVYEGGAIYSGGVATFTSVVLTNNAAPKGGAVSFAGSAATFEKCTLADNQATTGDGGAIHLDQYVSALTITNSTLQNNSAAIGGGAVSGRNANIVVTNSTLTGNTAMGDDSTTGGGAIQVTATSYFGTVDIRNSTIVGNQATGPFAIGGGIFVRHASTTVTLNSTILAENSNSNANDIGGPAKRNVDGSNNIFGAIDTNYIVLTGSSNQFGTAQNPLNPGLHVLGNRGGPTQTYGLHYNSSAINKGNNLSNLTTDQRGIGYLREVPSGAPDIGAFEGTLAIPFPFAHSIPSIYAGGGNSFVFSVTFDDETGINTTSLGSDDVVVAGPAAVGPIIFKGFSSSGNQVTATYEFAAPGGTWDPINNGDYSISLVAGSVLDNDAAPNAVDGQVLRVVRVATPYVYTVDQLGDVVDGNYGPGELSLREAVELANTKNLGTVDVVQFAPSLHGQTITLAGTTLTITDPIHIQGSGADKLTISGNFNSRVLTFAVPGAHTDSMVSDIAIIKGRSVGSFGGTIYQDDEDLTLTRVWISESQATGSGGAIHLFGGNLRIVDSWLFNNSSGLRGGAISSSTITANVEILRSSLTGNYTFGTGSSIGSGAGGAIYMTAGVLNITDSTISRNIAKNESGDYGGGAIGTSFAAITINNSTISENRAMTASGGAIAISDGGYLAINNSTITRNEALVDGGGIFFRNKVAAGLATVTMHSTILAGNINANSPEMFSRATSVTLTTNMTNSIIGAAHSSVIISGASNQVGTIGSPINPQVTPLTQLGGSTWVHGIMPGSPAIDAGANAQGMSFEQRGATYPRVIGPAADVGSTEGIIARPYSVMTATDVLQAGVTSWKAVVEYRDDTGIDVATIDLNDVKLLGPGTGSGIWPTSVTTQGSGQIVTATYEFAAPGGAFDPNENGVFRLMQQSGQVADGDVPSARFAQDGLIGYFLVAVPALYVVDALGDVDDGNTGPGQLTLREAVRLANTGSNGLTDTITFAANLHGKSIVLGGTELLITDPVTIQGPGADQLTIDANAQSRIFNFAIPAPGGPSIINGLQLMRGRAISANGGAILLGDESVALANMRITNNEANIGGAIYGDKATLVLTDSVITGNVGMGGTGGVSMTGSKTTIERSEIAFNVGTTGGLAVSSGSMIVNDSTFHHNTGRTAAGGIDVFTATITMTNCTVAENTSLSTTTGGGGVRLSSTAPATIRNSTIAYNTAAGPGAGISLPSSPSFTLDGTIVAHNVHATHPDLYSLTTNVINVLGNNNLVGVISDLDLFFQGTYQGGTTATPLDAKLTPLGDYGGPVVTMGLLPGSPAIDKGNNVGGVSFDQRGSGYPRVIGTAADVGAFEGTLAMPLAQAALVEVTSAGSASYVVTVVYADSSGIDLASIDVNDVQLSGGAYPAPIFPYKATATGSGTMVSVNYEFTPPGGAWDVADNSERYVVSLVAGEVVDLDGTPNASLGMRLGAFRVAVPAQIVVDTIADTVDPLDGKTSLREALALANAGPLLVGTQDIITFAPGLSGTITLTKELVLSDGVTIVGPGAAQLTISGNKLNRVFAFVGIDAKSQSLVSGLTLRDGSTTAQGGAIYSNDSLTLANVVISHNTAAKAGGAVYVIGTSLTVLDSQLSKNISGTSGGAIGSVSSTVTMARSYISENTATNDGGALDLSSDTTTITDSTLSKNSVTSTSSSANGAGISVSGGALTIINSTISTNSLPGAGRGGGINVGGNGALTIHNSTITKNLAGGSGGGIEFTSSTTVVNVTSTIIAQNSGAAHPDVHSNFTSTLKINVDQSIIGAVTDGDVVIQGVNQTGTLANPVDARLGDLDNYGGPMPTHAPIGGSPAVDKGSNILGLSFDQRGLGFPRSLGTTDIGSFEGVYPSPIPAATIGDITVAGGTTLAAKVIYTDETGVDVATIDVNDVILNGPGYATPASPVSVAITGSGMMVEAIYIFAAPTIHWDFTDNGNYTLSMQANQVFDLDAPTPRPAFAGAITSFNVNVAPSFVVDDASETNDGILTPGKISLREAINLANKTVGAQTITFAPDVFNAAKTITTFQEGEFLISDSLTIKGPTAPLTIQGYGRIFQINGPGELSVAFDHLTLTGGYAYLTGAAIWNVSEKVSLDFVTISGNTSNGRGGGIHSEGGVLQLTNCLVANNSTKSSTGNGGGIAVSGGALILRNCTVSGNSTAKSGSGGGIHLVYSATATIENCTIVNNSANGVGGLSVGTVQITSSIIAGNFTTSSNTNPDLSSPNATLINCILGVSDKNITKLTMIGGFSGTLAKRFDPQLTPLVDNDGRSTSHAPMPGSPALDAGSNPSGATFDQRGLGFPRVVGTSVDIGAIEGITPVPLATVTAAPVTLAGPTTYSFTVTYFDTLGIDVGSLGTGDLTVTGPGGFTATPALVAIDEPTNGSPRIATYSFVPPGGQWESSDTGSYSITMNSSQVNDIDASKHFVWPGLRATFSVTPGKIYAVDAIGDIDDGDYSAGQFTIREAIAAANLTANLPDLITFDPAVFSSASTITLTQGQLAITDSVTIIGAAAGLTISGGNTSRIFHTTLFGGSSVYLDNLTLSGGKANDYGGAIHHTNARLYLNQVIVENNVASLGAGGVFVDGSILYINNSVFRNNSVSQAGGFGGGAIYSDFAAILEIANSSFHNNFSATSGGAIVSESYLTIQGTSIYANVAGSVADGGSGGGLFASNLETTIINSTISGNEAIGGMGGGIANVNGALTIRNSTVAFNRADQQGGGLANAGSKVANVESTIFSDNDGADGNDVTGSVVANSSLIATSGGYLLSGSNNLLGVSARLLPLANNGGFVATHLPGPGSPVRDAGANLAKLSTDQRGVGFPREFGSATDIGAIESADSAPIATPNAAPVTGFGADSYTFQVTYRDDTGIDVATIGTGDVVVQGPNGFSAVPTLLSVNNSANGTPRIATYLMTPPGGTWTLDDFGTYSIMMAADQVGDLDVTAQFVPAGGIGTFRVDAPTTMVVSEATDIADGNHSPGKLSLREAIALANAALPRASTITFDATVFSAPQTIVLDRGVLAGRTALTIIGPGAALLTVDAAQNGRVFEFDSPSATPQMFTISGLTLKNGKTTEEGGGIIARAETVNLTDCVLFNNQAKSGGAIAVVDGNLTIVGGTIDSNQATAIGGGIYALRSPTIIQGVGVSTNKASSSGGGLYSTAAALTISDTTFDGNTASIFGGAAYHSQANLVVRNSTFSTNSANSGGGGLYLGANFIDLAIENSTFAFNSAPTGGAIQRTGTGKTLNISSTVFAKNGGGATPDISSTDSVTAHFSSFGANIGLSSNSSNNRPFGEDVKLGPLVNNGGPTKTHLPAADSPLIDQGSNPAGLISDQRGAGFDRKNGNQVDIGSVEVISPFPYGTVTLDPVLVAGNPTYGIVVTWQHPTGVQVANLGDGDLMLTGPGGFSTPAKFVSVDQSTDGTPRIASYVFTPPGGSWDAYDNGVYSVAVVANQVQSVTGTFAAATTLGTFTVEIAGVFVVTNLANSGLGSLRDAIERSNASSTSDTITFDPVVFGTPQTITIPDPPGGLLVLSDHVTIIGPGSSLLTIDANFYSWVFASFQPRNVAISGMTLIKATDGAIRVTGGTLELTDCVFRDNRPGSLGASCVYMDGEGQFVADRCVWEVNHGTNSGVAVYLNKVATVSMRESSIFNNSNDGLFVSASGSVQLIDSTIANNGGWGVSMSISGAIVVRGCTISGNERGLVVGDRQDGFMPTLTVENTTITGNNFSFTAGLWTNVKTMIESTIVAGNTGTTDPDLQALSTVTIRNSAIGTSTGYTPGPGSENNLAPGTVLQLGPLANNGGPTLTHAPLPGSPLIDAGSNPSNLPFDQRGFPRVVGPAADIGAVENFGLIPQVQAKLVDVTVPGGTVEYITVTYFDDTGIAVGSLGNGDLRVTGPNGFSVPLEFDSVDVNTDGTPRVATYRFTPPGGDWNGQDAGTYTISVVAGEVFDISNSSIPAGPIGTFAVLLPQPLVVTNDLDSGPGSLRAAILQANSFGTPDIVSFDPIFFATPRTITLTSGELPITDSVSIIGLGGNLVTISGNNVSRIFKVEGPNAIVVGISGLTMTNAYTNGFSVALYGGAIFCREETLNITDCRFVHNRASGGGGAIQMYAGGSLTVTGSYFEDNGTLNGDSGGYGNAISVDFANVSLSRCTFVGNYSSVANNLGGAVFIRNYSATAAIDVVISDSMFTGNTARRGGAIYVEGSGKYNQMVVQNCTIDGNTATFGGGGITFDNASGLVVRNSTITNNKVTAVPANSFGGGGIERYRQNGQLTLISSIVALNTSSIGPDIGHYSPFLALNSAIGTSTGYLLSIDSADNVPPGTDLKVGPLAANGGPTLTRAIFSDSPLYNAGLNPASLAYDQRGPGFPRTVDGNTDIGAFEYRPESFVSPTAQVVVNNGAAQRSMVNSLSVAFSQPVVFPTGLGNAIRLNRTGPGGPVGTVNLAFSQNANTINITFADPTFAPSGGSLLDGRYVLTLHADKINGGQFDGNGDGSVGDDLVLNLHRWFGDADGNGTVTAADFNAFRLAYGSTGSSIFDFDGNNQVSASDFNQFRLRYGVTLVP